MNEEETPIRSGSPFATADSPETAEGSPFAAAGSPTAAVAIEPPIEALMDVGPLRYTAMGAVAASAMVLLFAATASWWFPTGGTMIAALGSVLSILGLYSPYRFTASVLLGLHLCLFLFSYTQLLR